MLAIIAGSGRLPEILAAHCRDHALPYHVFGLQGEHDQGEKWVNHPFEPMRLDHLGGLLTRLKAIDCHQICLVGGLRRPKLWQLRPDRFGWSLLMRVMWKLIVGGDDALLRAVTHPFEKNGYDFVGGHHIMPELLMPHGCLTLASPMMQGFTLARDAAQQLGEKDRGQSIIWGPKGLIGTEDARGTDALIAQAMGQMDAFLYKCPKPQQDWRFDLPTIGPQTIEKLVQAGLKGVVVQAGGCLILDKEHAVALANQYGLFIYGDRG